MDNHGSLLGRLSAYSPAALRTGLGLLFLWFGISQLASPQSFLGYVPQWLSSYSSIVLMANGIFDALLGAFLLLGFFTRAVALLACLHLLSISLSMGYNDIAVRDAALAIAMFSVFLNGDDVLCIGGRLGRKR